MYPLVFIAGKEGRGIILFLFHFFFLAQRTWAWASTPRNLSLSLFLAFDVGTLALQKLIRPSLFFGGNFDHHHFDHFFFARIKKMHQKFTRFFFFRRSLSTRK